MGRARAGLGCIPLGCSGRGGRLTPVTLSWPKSNGCPGHLAWLGASRGSGPGAITPSRPEGEGGPGNVLVGTVWRAWPGVALRAGAVGRWWCGTVLWGTALGGGHSRIVPTGGGSVWVVSLSTSSPEIIPSTALGFGAVLGGAGSPGGVPLSSRVGRGSPRGVTSGGPAGRGDPECVPLGTRSFRGVPLGIGGPGCVPLSSPVGR